MARRQLLHRVRAYPVPNSLRHAMVRSSRTLQIAAEGRADLPRFIEEEFLPHLTSNAPATAFSDALLEYVAIGRPSSVLSSDVLDCVNKCLL